MRYIVFTFIIIAFINCKQEQSVHTHPVKNIVATKKDTIIYPSLREVFIDSSTIGIKGKYKLDVKSFLSDSIYVEIKFYEKVNSKWKLNQEFAFLKDGVSGCDVEISDFNNDGLNDMTYKSNIGARGANDIRTLFIFDKRGKLRRMKNSEQYPNLRYNAKLDCVDAYMVYGGSTTAFLKVENDSLREFANVTSFNGKREVTITNRLGKQKIIRSDQSEGDELRYSNYNPLEISDDN